MSSAHPILLDSRGIVEVSGSEAAGFLQGLITNDIARVNDGHATYAALLTPQGKIIHDFLIAAAPAGGFWLDCVKGHADDLTARLKKYRLRAKVTLTNRSVELAVVTWSEKPARAPGVIFADPRLPALGFRAIVLIADVAALRAANEAAYQARRLELGVPDASLDIPPETFFPLDCNLEELHGVDFEKGCYVGQELTARMKHRATARRRMLPVSADCDLPAAGAALKLGSTDVGELRGSVHTRGMALVRLDRLGGAREAMADTMTVRIGRPAYPLILPTEDERP
jgi:folate-binding protein YgfZ